jgi:hypothetical protein
VLALFLRGDIGRLAVTAVSYRDESAAHSRQDGNNGIGDTWGMQQCDQRERRTRDYAYNSIERGRTSPPGLPILLEFAIHLHSFA